MKMIEIQEQLRKVIPTLDDSFNSKINITSASVSAGKYIINSVGHGLSVDDIVVISGVDYVHQVTLLGKPLMLTASISSTLEIDFYNRIDGLITLRSNEAFYNGDFELKSTNDNRLNFEIKVNKNAPSSTVETIDVIEKDLCRYNGEFTVSEIIDVDNFAITTTAPDTVLLEGGTYYNLIEGIRINATVDINHIINNIQQYGTGGKWLYVSTGDSSISRDRNLKTDSPQRLEQGMDIQIDSWGNFQVFAIIPTGSSVDPVEDQDYCRNDLKFSLYKALLGYKPQSSSSAQYDYIYCDGDGLLTYSKGFYIHQYNFGCTIKINSLDGFKPKSCLVNEIETDYLKDEDIKATDKVTFTNN